MACAGSGWSMFALLAPAGVFVRACGDALMGHCDTCVVEQVERVARAEARALELEAQLTALHESYAILREDVAEVNRCMNWFSEREEFCGVYEGILRCINKRLKTPGLVLIRRRSTDLEYPAGWEGIRDYSRY